MALTRWQPPALRHEVADDGRVTWLELFFDLIYVAALIQLGDRLSDNVSWSGGAAFLGAFAVLWWTWTGTTAFTNRFAVDDVVHRLLTFAQMFAVGTVAILAAGTPDDWRTWFPIAYVVARLPLLAMYLRVRRRVPAGRTIADTYLAFFSTSCVVWLVSLALPENARTVAWAIGLAIDFAAPLVAVRRDGVPPTHDEHFQERYALFTVIVLGETFVKTLSEITETGITVQTNVFGGLAFVILAALWWTYFDDVAESEIHRRSAIASTPASNRIIWVYIHLPLTAGLTAFGVAAKKIVDVEAFDDAFKDTYTWLLALALVGALLSVAVLDVVTKSPHFAVGHGTRMVPRVVAAGVILAVAPIVASGSVDAIVGISLIAATVAIQIAVEAVLATKAERRVEREVSSQIADVSGSCEHLDDARRLDEPDDPRCDECDRLGVPWVQLRQCQSCGHVACCDDSSGHHATAHYERTGHPVMVSLESGADWAYCFDDDVSTESWDLPGRAETSTGD